MRSLSFRSGIVAQKQHASERKNRLLRGNVTRDEPLMQCGELNTLAGHYARVTFPHGTRPSRSLSCSFYLIVPERKERPARSQQPFQFVCCFGNVHA